jgi:threonyl-tRNA synthetase (EC 6.1.1.3)/Ser-tRNA(Thr) hydrolase (EC 3.1.1.-)
MAAGMVTVRARNGADLGQMTVDALIAKLKSEIAQRKPSEG